MPVLLNDLPVPAFTFSGGEVHVDLSTLVDRFDPARPVTITASLYQAEDIMLLLMTVDALRRCGDYRLHLVVPYVPYARQDRVCNPGEALGIRVMADLINSMACDRVTIIDPHSDVAGALINKCHIISQADIICHSMLAEMIDTGQYALIAPDAGAEKKTRAVARALAARHEGTVPPDVYYASKVRDTRTGAITATHFHDQIRGRRVLIIDDICDGGRTFVELAALLRAKGADDVRLYVTHGIFSQGLDVLRQTISHVYCAHTMLPPAAQTPGYLTLLPVNGVGC